MQCKYYYSCWNDCQSAVFEMYARKRQSGIGRKQKKQAIPTNNIVHPCIDVMAV